jgi:hypothetical protein
MLKQENFIKQRFPSKENKKYLVDEIRIAKNERSLQGILKATPSLLRCLSMDTIDFWCFDQPSLGGEYFPDFLLCCRTSAGYIWEFVEIESPQARILTKDGKPAATLRDAISQINDWRIWLRKNIAYAHNHLGFKDIDAEARGWVIIGRRSMISAEHVLKYRELSKNNLEIITYDRFIEMIPEEGF